MIRAMITVEAMTRETVMMMMMIKERMRMRVTVTVKPEV